MKRIPTFRHSRCLLPFALSLAGVAGGCGQLGQSAAPPSDPPASYHPAVVATPSPGLQGQIVEGKVGTQAMVVSLPPGFDASGGQRYPLLVYDHSYEGDHDQLVQRTSFPQLTQAAGWIAVCGDLDGPTHWGNEAALFDQNALIQAMITRYHADPARIYLVGFSMGGGTALLSAINLDHFPFQVAAVASSQGWVDLDQMRQVDNGAFRATIDAAYGGTLTDQDEQAHSPLQLASDLAGIPVYLEHGESDQVVPPSQSRELDDALVSLGDSPEFHLYPDLGHTEDTIHDQAIIDFFQGKRS